jgi:type III restriction enzyme
MALSTDFPTDPHAILDPHVRWYPGDEQLAELGYEMLLPPLVHKVRLGVKAWRDFGYAGASPTTRALLNHWFRTEHLLPQADGAAVPFRWYFAQQEAVESAIWLYEIENARDPYALMRYDSSGRVSAGMFPEDWPRYVMKLATGAGKTKGHEPADRLVLFSPAVRGGLRPLGQLPANRAQHHRARSAAPRLRRSAGVP